MPGYTDLLNKLTGRLLWATAQRKQRLRREEGYKNLAQCYENMLQRMWSRVGPLGEDPPTSCFVFDKSRAVAVLYFVRKKNNKKSHAWLMGHPTDKTRATILTDLNAGVEIPYFITDEIIAATIIASVLSNVECVDQKTVEKYLFAYYDTEPYDPLEVSRTWMSRLNTVVCNIWRISPIIRRAMNIVDERGLQFAESMNIALEEVKIPDLPLCLNSDNEDGRINMSYDLPSSCFYTIDHHGVAVCREYPNEYLDLRNYEAMLAVAGTIYKDITGCSNEDNGRGGAMAMLEQEPEWENNNLFPWDRDASKRFAVNFDDGNETHLIRRFESEVEALVFMRQQVDSYVNGTNNFYCRFPPLDENGVGADFELALLDSEGKFEETLWYWNPADGYHKPSYANHLPE